MKQRNTLFILMVLTSTTSLFAMDQQKQELLQKAIAQAKQDGSEQTVEILTQLQALLQNAKTEEKKWTQPVSER